MKKTISSLIAASFIFSATGAFAQSEAEIIMDNLDSFATDGMGGGDFEWQFKAIQCSSEPKRCTLDFDMFFLPNDHDLNISSEQTQSDDTFSYKVTAETTRYSARCYFPSYASTADLLETTPSGRGVIHDFYNEVYECARKAARAVDQTFGLRSSLKARGL